MAVTSAHLRAAAAAGQPADLLLPQDIVWRVVRQPRTGRLVLASDAIASATTPTASGESITGLYSTHGIIGIVIVHFKIITIT